MKGEQDATTPVRGPKGLTSCRRLHILKLPERAFPPVNDDPERVLMANPIESIHSPRRDTTPAPGAGWSSRLREAADTVAWVAGLNLLWIAFTLAGLVVLGAAPASAAAATVARRRLRGESKPLVRAFASAWRAEFIPANRLLLPMVAVDGLLVANWVYYSQQEGALAGLVAIASVVGMVLALAAGAVLVTMRAHYDVAGGDYRTAAKWISLNPGSLLLLAVTATLIGAVTAFIPGLLPFLSIGAWLTVSTALCLRSSPTTTGWWLGAARHMTCPMQERGNDPANTKRRSSRAQETTRHHRVGRCQRDHRGRLPGCHPRGATGGC